jgi:hypothetical protein
LGIISVLDERRGRASLFESSGRVSSALDAAGCTGGVCFGAVGRGQPAGAARQEK